MEQLRAPIRLSEQQLAQLRHVTHGGAGNYPAGYALIHGWIKDHPAAQRDGTAFWFEQARGINNADSLSSHFIRRHTQNGLDLTDIPESQRLGMQELSDKIAYRVTRDILTSGQIAPLAEVLNRDIAIALGDGHVSLGGWGGAFYYWQTPFKPMNYKGRDGFPRDPDGSFKTVGEEIIRRGELPLLIETSARTLAQMQLHGELPMRHWDDALQTGFKAGIPLQYQIQIGARAGSIVAEVQTEQAKQAIDGARQGVSDRVEDIIQRIHCAAFPRLPDCPPDGASVDPQRLPPAQPAIEDPRDPRHAQHADYVSVRSQVADAYAKVSLPRSEDDIERITAAALVRSQEEGLPQIGSMTLLNAPGSKLPGDSSLLAVHAVSAQHFPPHNAVVNVPLAVQTPPEAHYQALLQITQQNERQAQLERELETQREQQRQTPPGPVMV